MIESAAKLAPMMVSPTAALTWFSPERSFWVPRPLSPTSKELACYAAFRRNCPVAGTLPLRTCKKIGGPAPLSNPVHSAICSTEDSVGEHRKVTDSHAEANSSAEQAQIRDQSVFPVVTSLR
jgi:hypothetical protein